MFGIITALLSPRAPPSPTVEDEENFLRTPSPTVETQDLFSDSLEVSIEQIDSWDTIAHRLSQTEAKLLSQAEKSRMESLSQSETHRLEALAQTEAFRKESLHDQQQFQIQLLTLMNLNSQNLQACKSTITPVTVLAQVPTDVPYPTNVPRTAPLPPMKRSWAPDLPLDISNFENWSNLFLIKASGCELNSLYSPSEQNFVSTTSDSELDHRLYSRIMECLGTTNQFTKNLDKVGQGLSLWKILAQTYGPTLSEEYMHSKLGDFWTTMSRSANESVDEYYNRFRFMVSQLPMKGTNIPEKSLRLRFLLTLGNEFQRFVDDSRDLKLEQRFVDLPWESVLELLRKISASHKLSSSFSPTASSMGYASANAVIISSKDSAIKALEEKIATLEKAASAKVHSEKKQAYMKAYMNRPDFYCHTHGFGKNPLHTSLTCQKPAEGHNPNAHCLDTMGGSLHIYVPK